jgi:hypothetical protein
MSNPKPSTYIETFLNFIDTAKSSYQFAYDTVGEEDKGLQDLLHELELAEGNSARGKASTKLRNSRKNRRINKDITLEYEDIVNFWEEPQNKMVLNKLRQLLGKQRKNENYIYGQRVYKPRKDKVKQ